LAGFGVFPFKNRKEDVICREETEPDPEARDLEPAGARVEAAEAVVAEEAAGASEAAMQQDPGVTACARTVVRGFSISWGLPATNRIAPSAEPP